MASQSTETYDAFTRFGVPQLKDFLRKRDLPVSGRKAELVALAYAASLLKIPLVKTASERQAERQKQYEATLNVDDQQLPDPFLDLKSGWEDESVGMSKWPPTMIADIQTYLQKHETKLTCASLSKRLLKDYKEGKAFSYFSSLFLFEILYHKVTDDSPYCCLKSKCIPSQRIRDEPHTLWVIIDKESGEIKSSYCSCIAGLGRSCNHITAVLLKLDFCWKYGFVLKSKTSLPCTWKAAGKSLIVQPTKMKVMKWKSPHAENNDHNKVINPTERTEFMPHERNKSKGMTFTEFLERAEELSPLSVIFAEHSPQRNTAFDSPSKTSQVFPAPIPPAISVVFSQSNIESVADFPKYTSEMVTCIEQSTLGQNDNELWTEQRKGRITASNFHSVFTKVKTLQSVESPESVNTKSLTCKLLGCVVPNPEISALKYGRRMEPIAKEEYLKIMKERGHKNVNLYDCGLFIDKSDIYLGASPDAIVNCDCCGTGLFECKCPLSISHVSPSAENSQYLVISDGITKLKRNHAYYTQVQGQMAVTQKQWCDFFVYSSYGFHFERIDFDSSYWKSVKSNLRYFYDHYMLPELKSHSCKWSN